MSLDGNIKSVKNDFLTDLDAFQAQDADLSHIRQKYLARNGLIADLFKQLGQVSNEDRPKYGQLLNQLKVDITEKIDSLSSSNDSNDKSDSVDIALPGKHYDIGSVHILEQTLNETKKIFNDIGFSIAYGPEIDDDYHNFGALNFPEHHPARDMQDTFYIGNDSLLRTHTSSSQVHFMENNEPPIRILSPGRVYRNEDISVRSYCLFHQIEGLYVDKNVTFSDLKGTLEYFAKQFFGPKTKIRFRPSYFPFTEPSAEMDVYWGLNSESDHRITKGTGWLEILGCGMVNPEVFKSVDYDVKKWNGYAFGLGIERIAMLKYGIEDIRLLYEGNINFLGQFK